jgi:hypothetical protein
MGERTVSTATQRADELFMRLMLTDKRFGLPPHVSVVAADLDSAAKIAWRNAREGMPTVVVAGDGSEVLVRSLSRVERLLDRLCGRARVRIDARGPGEAAFRPCGRADRATLERELLTAS